MESTFYPYLGALVLDWPAFSLIGTIIRAKVKFFQTLSLPRLAYRRHHRVFRPDQRVAWLGIPTSTGWKDDHPGDVFSTITFHLFAFGFVGIRLCSRPRSAASGKVVARGALWIALVFGLTLLGAGARRQGDVFDAVAGLLFGGARLQPATATSSAPASRRAPARRRPTPPSGRPPIRPANAAERRAGLRRRRFPRGGHRGRAAGLLRHQDAAGLPPEGVPASCPRYFLRGLMDQAATIPTCSHSTTHPANIDSVGLPPRNHGHSVRPRLCLSALWWLCTMPTGINGARHRHDLSAWGMFLAMIAA